MGQLRVYGNFTVVHKQLSRFKSNVKKDVVKASDDWGQHQLVRDILVAANAKGIQQYSPKGMFKTTAWIQEGMNGYLVMPKSGMWQDNARPHRVSAYKKPWLQAWIRARDVRGPDGKFIRGFYFRPKPFIKEGASNALRRASPYYLKALRNSIRTK